MGIDIHLDRSSKTPAYRQIIQQITMLIRDGVIGPGDKLPPERELANTLKIARGTIKKAYESLARDHVIDVARGNGSFVSARQDVLSGDRKAQAVKAIEHMIDELEALKFSGREISTLVELKLIEREERLRTFHVAAVDCNPEALSIFEHQIGHFYQIKLTRVLLDKLKAAPDPQKRLEQFDLILTTTTHYAEVQRLAPELQDRLIQIAVSPSQETIIEIAALHSGLRMGVICESVNFRDIVKKRLKALDLLPGEFPFLRVRDEMNLPDFLKELDVVFVPPGYQIQRQRETVYAVQQFTGRGGRVIVFDYQIERGSLLHLQERISQLPNLG